MSLFHPRKHDDVVVDDVPARLPPPRTVKARKQHQPEAASPAAPPPLPHVATYTVEQGDDLPGIAKQVYGDPEKWRTLYAANRGVLGELAANDDSHVDVVPGQVLVVPAW